MATIKFGSEVYTWFMQGTGQAYDNKLDHMIRVAAQAGFSGIEPMVLTPFDNYWLGDFKALDIELADNSDGYRYDVSLEKPFVQRNSHYAWAVQALSYERENPIYEAGERVGEVGEETESFAIS